MNTNIVQDGMAVDFAIENINKKQGIKMSSSGIRCSKI
jgi:hypothetical protein